MFCRACIEPLINEEVSDQIPKVQLEHTIGWSRKDFLIDSG